MVRSGRPLIRGARPCIEAVNSLPCVDGCSSQCRSIRPTGPTLVVDTGNSLAPYNHIDTGSPFAVEYVLGRQVGDNTINP